MNNIKNNKDILGITTEVKVKTKISELRRKKVKVSQIFSKQLKPLKKVSWIRSEVTKRDKDKIKRDETKNNKGRR